MSRYFDDLFIGIDLSQSGDFYAFTFPEEMYHADTETYFGLPDERKFPLDSRQHVMSAIKFFNYCPPQKRRFLAKRIKERMKVFGIRYDSLTESKENSFYNYTGYD